MANLILKNVDAVINIITESSSDSSEEELEFLNLADKENHIKINDYINKVPLDYNPSDFQNHFRLTRNAVEMLCEEIRPFRNICTPGRSAVPLIKSLLITLWTLANQETFREIGNRFGLSKGNCHTVFIKTCQQICRLKPKYIVWPVGIDLSNTIKDFKNLQRPSAFPNVVGCVDGTHININGPQGDDSFYNKKGQHSAILQVICNSKLQFIDVYFGWPGSCHNARVWQNSPIYLQLKDHMLPQEYHLLGDTAYPLDTFIMVPFKDNGHLSNREKKYNKILNSTRVVVDQSIGRLKQCFRRLNYLDSKLENLKYYVITACVLHNYMISYNIPFEADINIENIEIETLDEEPFSTIQNSIGVLKRRDILLQITEV